jgi:hypothetical protein
MEVERFKMLIEVEESFLWAYNSLSIISWSFCGIIFQDLASAGATKRPTCCVLVLTKPTKGEIGKEDQEKLRADYDQVVSDVSELTSSLF